MVFHELAVGAPLLKKVRNIVVYAIKSEKIVHAALLAATLFPNAIYHVVSAIPKYSSRTTYTKLYQEVMKNLAEDSLTNIKIALLQKGIRFIREKLLHSRKPSKELVRYIKNVKADLIVIATVPQMLGRMGAKLFLEASKIRKPMLIYTLVSKEPTKIKTIILLTSKLSLESEALLSSLIIAHRMNSEILVVTMETPEVLDIQLLNILTTIYNAKIHIELSTKHRDKLIEYAIEISNEADLLIVDRDIFAKHKYLYILPWIRKLSKEEEKLLSSSLTPILYL